MAELNVTKKSIRALLGEMQRRKFIIPEYQRPYEWDAENCGTLWADLESFFWDDRPHENEAAEYYFGTIVTCAAEQSLLSHDLEVIDGQQRLTSFFLLLRAFYRCLDGMQPPDLEVAYLKSQIAPCIWNVSPLAGIVVDPAVIHIESKVIAAANDVFHEILASGASVAGAKDLYSTNFEFFLKKIEEFAKTHPMNWKNLLVAILNSCIILPIECGQFETALRIFTTLNDRGLPLADSDIFKAKIYQSKDTSDEKTEFTKIWGKLTETVKLAGLSLDDLFRNYSHVIRSRNGDKSKEIALRRFYGHDKFARLRDAAAMPELTELANFWAEVKEAGNADVATGQLLTVESRTFLHCLSRYPNEYWRYVTSVYFLKRRQDPSFAADFAKFLRYLTAWLFSEFVLRPTVNAIKDACYQLAIDIAEAKPLPPRQPLPEDFGSRLSGAVRTRIGSALVLLHAYLHPKQQGIIPAFHIEHIFPSAWKIASYDGWNQADAAEWLERFGNYIPFESRLNIQAGAGYFGQKKLHYAKSAIASVQELAARREDDWLKGDIDDREVEFVKTIDLFFTSYLGGEENFPPS